MNVEKAQKMREELAVKIAACDIAGYLRDEAIRFLDYIHYYKLKNICKHEALFLQYLTYLDTQHTEQVQKLLASTPPSQVFTRTELDDQERAYFLSDAWWRIMVDQGLDIHLNDSGLDRYELLSIVMRIKGMFLLSATEFCHASHTRISLYERLVAHDS